MRSFEFLDSSQCRSYLDALSGRTGRPSWSAVAESPFDGRAPAPVTPRCRPFGGPFDALRSPSLVMLAAGDNVAGFVSVLSVCVCCCGSGKVPCERRCQAPRTTCMHIPPPPCPHTRGGVEPWYVADAGPAGCRESLYGMYCTRDKNFVICNL